MSRDYGVLRPERFSERATFIIDKQGIIRWKQIVPPNRPRDLDEILEQLRRITSGAS